MGFSIKYIKTTVIAKKGRASDALTLNETN